MMHALRQYELPQLPKPFLCADPNNIGLLFKAAGNNCLAWAGSVDKKYVAGSTHELIVPTNHYHRIADLPQEALEDLWALLEDRVTEILETEGLEAVAILINDGISAGQTVGHAHAHIVGIDTANLIRSLPLNFMVATQQYSAPETLPDAELCLTELDSTELTRSLSTEIKSKMRLYGSTTGFSVFSVRHKREINDPYNLVVQRWSSKNPRPFGLTNLMRVLNGYSDKPYSWPTVHLQRHFAPKYE